MRTATCTYDEVGNRTAVVDYNGHATYFEYYALNRRGKNMALCPRLSRLSEELSWWLSTCANERDALPAALRGLPHLWPLP